MTTRSNEELLDVFASEMLDDGLASIDELASIAKGLAPIAPSSAARSRLMASVKTTSRFAQFAAGVAKILDVAQDRAKTMLDAIDDAVSWVPSPLPMAALYHVDGGPRVANAITGFIKIKAGDSFPAHTHLGREIIMVVQGAYRDDDGSVYRAGAIIEKDAGTSHSFVALPGPDLVYLGVVYEGLEVAGMKLTHDDPRI